MSGSYKSNTVKRRVSRLHLDYKEKMINTFSFEKYVVKRALKTKPG